MDRFIVLIRKSNEVDYKYLKSNMDRFIDCTFNAANASQKI